MHREQSDSLGGSHIGGTMIKSMTGFGRCELADESRKLTVEMKAVNHRYLDVSIKMPKKLNFFESAIRNLLKQYIQRGKVDVFITYEDYTENKLALHYNHELAGEYVDYIARMAEEFHLENDLTAQRLARFPEVLTMEEQTLDEKQLWEFLEQAIKNAGEQLVASRIAEGENLKKDLLAKLEVMLELVDRIEARAPQIQEEYRAKLTAKVEELLTDVHIDEGRLATEITIFADKICTDEELVRLRSHISGTMDTLTEGDSIGRKLDFIAQEMNREANTILSKANDLMVSNIAIELKTDIEKVREQIQNIE